MAIAFTALVDRHDVWVVETGCASRLDMKTIHFIVAGQAAGADHFDGDAAFQLNLKRKVNDPHSAAA